LIVDFHFLYCVQIQKDKKELDLGQKLDGSQKCTRSISSKKHRPIFGDGVEVHLGIRIKKN
jgi:hypothetical protein